MNEDWITIEDFATLFRYFWHRDFPISPTEPGAKRADWTNHIGVVIRNIGELAGLAARFESGGRTDALLRSRMGDEIAAEWEWEDIWEESDKLKGNELGKLKTRRKIWPKDKRLRYAVLVTYTDMSKDQGNRIRKIYDEIARQWEKAPWPLLFILIESVESKVFRSGREFKNMQMSVFDGTGQRIPLPTVPACPWKIQGTRWCSELTSSDSATGS